jgi:uncharacterized protein (TIGR02145 family)
MQQKDLRKFNIGLNKDDNPADLENFKPGEYTDALNMRVASSNEQQGFGVMETLQGEIEMLINVSSINYYYGEAIGAQFIYEGYEEVQIGNQVWMKNNWKNPYSGSKVYNNDEANRDIYGGLYKWDQIMAEDFLPDGWRVPTEADIDELLSYLGGEIIAGGKMKEVGIEKWLTPNTDADDSSGFKGLPGGKYDSGFDLLQEMGLFWLADEIISEVTIVTEKNGTFSITFRGEGIIGVDWGDGASENVEINLLGDTVVTHDYTTGGIITISNPSVITEISSASMDIIEVNNLILCENIEVINFSNNSIVTFPTSALWTSLRNLNLQLNSLTAIVLREEWTLVESIALGFNDIVTIDTYATWIVLGSFTIDVNPLTAITTHAEWTEIQSFGVSETLINVLAIPNTWINVQTLNIHDNPGLVALTTHPEWVALQILELNNCSLASLITHPEWINLVRLTINNNGIANIIAHHQWNIFTLVNFYASGNAIINAVDINNILIELDDAGKSSGTIDLSLGTNAAPTGAGITAKNNLIARGVSVLTN